MEGISVFKFVDKFKLIFPNKMSFIIQAFLNISDRYVEIFCNGLLICRLMGVDEFLGVQFRNVQLEYVSQINYYYNIFYYRN